jgi:hypothetical protein
MLAFDWVVVHLHNGTSIHPCQSAQNTYMIPYYRCDTLMKENNVAQKFLTTMKRRLANKT